MIDACFDRDEVVTKNKFLEEEARRNAEAVQNGEMLVPEARPKAGSADDDDIFYDSAAELKEE